jgi:hypothetical protein
MHVGLTCSFGYLSIDLCIAQLSKANTILQSESVHVGVHPQGMSLGLRGRWRFRHGLFASLVARLLVWLVLLGLERVHVGNGLRAEWWLMFPAHTGHRDGLTC